MIGQAQLTNCLIQNIDNNFMLKYNTLLYAKFPVQATVMLKTAIVQQLHSSFALQYDHQFYGKT